MSGVSDKQKQYVESDLSRRILGAVTEITSNIDLNSRLIDPLANMPVIQRVSISRNLIGNLLVELMNALPFERKAHLLMTFHRDLAGKTIRCNPAAGFDNLVIAMLGDPLSPTPIPDPEVRRMDRTAQPLAQADEDQQKS